MKDLLGPRDDAETPLSPEELNAAGIRPLVMSRVSAETRSDHVVDVTTS